MDVMLLRQFQRQVKFQCECVLVASGELEASLAKRDITATFCAIQALLSSAANISKALWGERKTKNALAVRAPLRDSLQVTDSSPLNPRNMRNHYDHFDERLDEWWRKSKTHNLADMNLIPRAAIQGFEPIERLRAFDPATGDLTFWGDDFNIRVIVDEAKRILPVATQEAAKPHWEQKHPAP